MVPTTNLNAEILPTSGTIPGRVLGVISGPTVRCVIRRTFSSNVRRVLVVAGEGGNTVRSRFSRGFRLRTGLTTGRDGGSVCRSILTYSGFNGVCFLHRGRAGNLNRTILYTGGFINGRPFTILCNSSIVLSGARPYAGRLYGTCRGCNGNMINIGRIPNVTVAECYSLGARRLRNGYCAYASVVRGPGPRRVVNGFSVLNEIMLPPRVFRVLRGAPLNANGRLRLASTVGALTRARNIITIRCRNIHCSVNGGFKVLRTGVRINLRRPSAGSRLGTCVGGVTTRLSWRTRSDHVSTNLDYLQYFGVEKGVLGGFGGSGGFGNCGGGCGGDGGFGGCGGFGCCGPGGNNKCCPGGNFAPGNKRSCQRRLCCGRRTGTRQGRVHSLNGVVNYYLFLFLTIRLTTDLTLDSGSTLCRGCRDSSIFRSYFNAVFIRFLTLTIPFKLVTLVGGGHCVNSLIPTGRVPTTSFYL